IILDPVYGTIHLDYLSVKIIDTPWFQRLRYIKQLSLADYVYPGATHTRFAHSIGVYHLARQMIKQIETHPTTKMDDFDKRCIRVAALCHDLGHGPFSHLYEQIGKELGVVTLEHEDVSQAVMEQILRGDSFFEKCFDTKFEEAITLIKTLINPKNINLNPEVNKKRYMYQIVSNKYSGVDVDKWDYFNRDAIACGVPEGFQYDRALSVARVVKVDETAQGEKMDETAQGDKKDKTKSFLFELAYRDYDALNFYNMYNTRLTMYRKVYKHKVVVALELMMKDVFTLVQKQLTQGEGLDLFPLKNANDLTDSSKLNAFQELNDSVLFTIKGNNEAGLLIDRIHNRKLYVMIIDILIPEDKDPEQKEKEVRQTIEDLIKKHHYNNPTDVEIKKITFDYGDKRDDPVSKLCFYKKGRLDSGYRTSRKWVSSILPSSFQEVHLRVYYKKESPAVGEEFKKALEDLEKQLHASDEGSSPTKMPRQ
ncbi:hypothetical protein CHS0354_016425, partial [Potamilus streckersoni]